MPAHSQRISIFGHGSHARRSTAALAALALVVGLTSVALGGTGTPAAGPSGVRTAPAPVIVDEEFLADNDPDVQAAGWPTNVWIVQLDSPSLARRFDATWTANGRLDVEGDASRAALEAITAEQDALLADISEALDREVAIETVTTTVDVSSLDPADLPEDFDPDITYEFRYRHAFNGFAIQMSRDEADIVATLDGIKQIQANYVRYPITDNGPEWIGADAIWAGTADTTDPCGTEPTPPTAPTGEPFPGATCGEGVLVGIIDTGVNTNHASFADIGPVDGYNHFNNDPAPTVPEGPGGIPSVTGYYGSCAAVNVHCNDKLIGAYDFTSISAVGPEDENGHGSHTASTTAGNVLSADLDFPTIDYADVPISGVAPHANIISYKACIYPFISPTGACTAQQLVLSIDQAVADEVDVINYSIGGGPANPYTDSDSQAFLDANEAGSFPSVSAGNAGPGPGTVGSPANSPWVMSVGASTHHRAFLNGLIDLAATTASMPAPANGEMDGLSITGASPPNSPIVWAGDFGFRFCAAGTTEASFNPFFPGQFSGDIVVCERSMAGQPGGRVQKCDNVRQAGAVGCVLINQQPQGNSIVADTHTLPAVHLTADQGDLLLAWLIGDRPHPETGAYDRDGRDEWDAEPAEDPTGQIRGTTLDVDPVHGDVMAGFSSRGPNAPVPDVIKPDVTAPGVDILAAWRDLPTNQPPSPVTGGTEFNVISGTSMSSPHDAGAAALLHGVHPDWTVDQLKSAMMTTAFTDPTDGGDEVHPVMDDDLVTESDPFDMGAGRVDISLATNAGLVLDEELADYEASNPAGDGDPTTLNIASLGDATCEFTCSWERVVTSTVEGDVLWSATVSAPEGMSITVSPSSFTLSPDTPQTITVTVDVTGRPPMEWHFGEVTLVPDDDTIPNAHFPIAVFGGATGPPTLLLHFHGNPHDSSPDDPEATCTGDGWTDTSACDGPLLLPDPELYDGNAAVYGPVSPLFNGTLNDPQWRWYVDEPTSVFGPMTVKWWASCDLCGDDVGLSADWWISLWVGDDPETTAVDESDAPFFRQRVTATPAEAGVPSLLTSTVKIPAQSTGTTVSPQAAGTQQVSYFTTSEYFLLMIEPVYIDSQATAYIYYDSMEPCPGVEPEEGEETAPPCDSVVFMPVVGLVVEPPAVPVLTLDNTTYSVNEADGTASFTVQRSVVTTGETSVDIEYTDGTATEGADYTAETTNVIFADGETEKQVTIPITDDTLEEDDETVEFGLANPSGGAVLGDPSAAVLTIVDDDTAAATTTPTQAPTDEPTQAPTDEPTDTASPAATASPSPRVRFIPDTAFEWATQTPEGVVTLSSLLVLLGSAALLAAPRLRAWLRARR